MKDKAAFRKRVATQRVREKKKRKTVTLTLKLHEIQLLAMTCTVYFLFSCILSIAHPFLCFSLFDVQQVPFLFCPNVSANSPLTLQLPVQEALCYMPIGGSLFNLILTVSFEEQLRRRGVPKCW